MSKKTRKKSPKAGLPQGGPRRSVKSAKTPPTKARPKAAGKPAGNATKRTQKRDLGSIA